MVISKEKRAEYRRRFIAKHGREYLRDAARKYRAEHRTEIAERKRKWYRKKYDDHILNRRCVWCGDKPTPGTVLCEPCHEKARQNAREQIEIRKNENRCVCCSAPLIEDEKTYCSSCLAKPAYISKGGYL